MGAAMSKHFKTICISALLLMIIPICERDRAISGTGTGNAFEGQELVCAIDVPTIQSLKTGFSYELIQRFASDNNCSVRILTQNNKEDYLDSLKAGAIDLLITDETQTKDTDGILLSNLSEDWPILAVRDAGDNKMLHSLNRWISHMRISGEWESMRSQFKKSNSRISPYDNLIKAYAAKLGWDWRLLASIIYNESKFAIFAKSSRGACGLMQVMPQIASHYGVHDLTDPESNIKAGTMILQKLQREWIKRNLEGEELLNFILASYNAGKGKIIDYRNFAQQEGADPDRWEDIVKVAPIMREQGLFLSSETIAYVEKVLATYESYCQSHPEC